MATLDANGYLARTFAAIKLDFQTAFQTAFGGGIDLTDQSPQGTLINILSEIAENLEDIGLDLFVNFDVNTATGVFLDNIATIKGTQRNDGTEAVINVDLTSTTFPYTIPINTQFRYLNDPTLLFTNTTPIVVTSSPFNTQLIAMANGLTSATIGQGLQSVSLIPQLTNIVITAIADGTNTESDADLRARLKRSNGQNASNDLNSLFTTLVNRSNVQKVNILDNDTGVTDINGVPAHSIECLVLGDTDQAIGDAIFSKKCSGVGTNGSTTVTSLDIQGNPHIINFSRPMLLTAYIRVTVTAKEFQQTVDSTFFQQMKDQVLAYVDALKVGEDVSYTTVYGIFAQYNSFDIVTLEQSNDNSTWVQTNLAVGVREYAKIVTENTDITIVVV